MSLFVADTQTPDILSLTPSIISKITQPIKPWGRLYSTYIHLEPVDLKNKTFTLGRSEDCDIVITEQKVPIHRVIAISKTHFILTREDNLVYIKDMSKNGTFLNGKLIGKGRTNILQNDDEISIGFKGLKVYIFKVLSDLDNNIYLPESLRKRYQVSKMLGRGACGEVKLVFDKESLRAYAVKKIIKAKSACAKNYLMNHPDKISREIKILKSLDHPCVINMLDFEETDDSVFMILEYMEGGELTELVETAHPIDEPQAKFLFYQMALALHYLHSHGIIHRDLKPENVLLKNSTPQTLVKISDFGLSRIIDDDDNDVVKTICGTPMYAAPEIVARQLYGYQVDIWSLGVVLYYMLAKEVPFKGNNRESLNQRIKGGKYDFDAPVWTDVSEEAKNLVGSMLTIDPTQRIKLDEILRHDWIANDYPMLERVDELLYGEHRTYTAFSDSESSFVSDDSGSPPAKRSRSN